MDLGQRDFMNTPPVKAVRFVSVTEALDKYSQGDTTDFEFLKNELADPDLKDSQIISWLQEFRCCVTRLQKDHEQLVLSALRLPWVWRSRAVVDEYLLFLGNLVSAQTVYLCTCIKAVVNHFIPKRVTICEDGVDISDSDDEDENLPIVFDRSHEALQTVGRYVPSTSRFLVPVLQDKFPAMQKSPRTLECYVHNLLRISVYMPSLRRAILELVMEKLLKLDVSMSRAEMTEAEEGKLHQEEEGLFDMDEELDSRSTTHPVAERLDALMGVMMAYIKDICHVEGAFHAERSKELFTDLVCVFDKLVLPTHASSHVQFLLFYICSFKLALAEAFLDHLWRILQNLSQPAVLRQAAAGYLGSFLARARFIPLPTVRAFLDLLISWVHEYLDGQDNSGRQLCCDAALHGPFYAACQAIFYMFVFRHRAIMEPNIKKGLEYLQSLNLERVVVCPLNPLRVCLPSVASMFAAVTRKYQVVFCYTILEKNSRHSLPVVRSSVGGSSVSADTNPLDTFFPFDPYLLKRSGQLIEPLYQVWEDLGETETTPGRSNQQSSKHEEEDSMSEGTPHTDGITGMTPGSVELKLCSPGSMNLPLPTSPWPF